MQVVISKILLDHVAFVATADDKLVDAVGGIYFHNMPEDRLPPLLPPEASA